MNTSTREDFAQLEAVRLIAAVAVVVTHTGFWSGVYTTDLLGNAVQRLEVGVAIFFVLSGFLLGRPYILTATTGSTAHLRWRTYLRRRFFRIMPVYWVAVVSALVLLTPNHSLGFGRWVSNLILIEGYVSVELPRGLTQMWSLTVEATFYLLLPLLGAALIRIGQGRPRRLIITLTAMSLLSIVWVTITHLTDAEWGLWLGRWAISYGTWFFLGIILATVHACRNDDSWSRRISRWASDRTSAWIVAASVFAIVSTPLGGEPYLQDIGLGESLVRHIGYAAVAVLFVAPCIFSDPDDKVSRAFSHPRVRRTGQLSFGLFCVHMLVIELIFSVLGFELFNSSWALLTALVLTISLALSELIYRWIELPAIRYGRSREKASEDTSTPITKTAR